MFTKGTQSKARALEICSELLGLVALPTKVEAVASEDFTVLKVAIEFKKPPKDSASFVGALEYILRLMLLQEGEEPRVLLDINDYREKRQQELEKLVTEKIASIGGGGQSVALSPMNAYDRRLVHRLVTKDPSLVTESFGMGRERRVIIKKREELG